MRPTCSALGNAENATFASRRASFQKAALAFKVGDPRVEPA